MYLSNLFLLEIQELQKVEKQYTSKGENKNHTIELLLAFVFSSHAMCMRERERLANAHVFCLDGDVVP